MRTSETERSHPEEVQREVVQIHPHLLQAREVLVFIAKLDTTPIGPKIKQTDSDLVPPFNPANPLNPL
jgi:hypothetical protein